MAHTGDKKPADQIQDEQLKYGKDFIDSDLVTCDEHGGFYTPYPCYICFKALMKKLGLPEEVRQHDLRHNFASICYNAGVDVLTAQKYLGHSDPKTTLDIYSHLSEAKEKQSESKLISVFDRLPDDAPGGKVAEKLPKSCRGEKAGKGQK